MTELHLLDAGWLPIVHRYNGKSLWLDPIHQQLYPLCEALFIFYLRTKYSNQTILNESQ